MSVTQGWVQGLSFMQQSVLITAVRGPDGVHKDHIAKLLLRWFRRCIMYSAFDWRVIDNPVDPAGGNFTGPSLETNHPVMDWESGMDELARVYLRAADELPHHFQLHLMHAAEVLGYKHPHPRIRKWWHSFYLLCVTSLHVQPETEELMDQRLGDNERAWREASRGLES